MVQAVLPAVLATYPTRFDTVHVLSVHPQEMQVEARVMPTPVEYLPAAHPVHITPDFVEYFPAAHVVHEVAIAPK